MADRSSQPHHIAAPVERRILQPRRSKRPGPDRLPAGRSRLPDPGLAPPGLLLPASRSLAGRSRRAAPGGPLSLAASTCHAILHRNEVGRLSHLDRATGEPVHR